MKRVMSVFGVLAAGLMTGCAIHSQAPIKEVAYDFSDYESYGVAHGTSPEYGATRGEARAEGQGASAPATGDDDGASVNVPPGGQFFPERVAVTQVSAHAPPIAATPAIAQRNEPNPAPVAKTTAEDAPAGAGPDIRQRDARAPYPVLGVVLGTSKPTFVVGYNGGYATGYGVATGGYGVGQRVDVVTHTEHHTVQHTERHEASAVPVPGFLFR